GKGPRRQPVFALPYRLAPDFRATAVWISRSELPRYRARPESRAGSVARVLALDHQQRGASRGDAPSRSDRRANRGDRRIFVEPAPTAMIDHESADGIRLGRRPL